MNTEVISEIRRMRRDSDASCVVKLHQQEEFQDYSMYEGGSL